MGRYLRWQAAIALLGLALLATLLRYAAYNFTTVTAPDRGGVFVEGVVGNPQYINPLLSQYNQVDGLLSALIFSGLTRLDERGNVVSDLAENWAVSSDGLAYDFRLKPGRSWHDGVAVTAADVLYTVGAMQAEDFPGPPWLSTLWRSVRIEAPDGPEGLAVRFTLKQPFAPFIDYTTIGLLPRHLWEKVPTGQMMSSQLNTRPVGTGPFQLSQLTATRAELVPNPRYPGPTPYLTGLTIRWYPDHQSLLPAFDRGEIDGISWITGDDMGEAAKRKDLQLFSAPLSGYSLIYLNLQNPNTPFFKDRGVRQALLYALDRQALVDHVLGGQGIVAHSPILPGTWAHDPEIPQYPYDPARAAQLLDEAGWKDSDGDGVRDQGGARLAFILLGDDPRMTEAIARQWAAVGVKATPQVVTMAGLTSDFLVQRTFDAAIVHWELSGDPDPYPLWHSTQIKEGQNYAGWSLRGADEAIERARGITDQAARQAFYFQFQRIFAAEVPALLLYHPVYTYGVRSKVHDVQMGPLNSPADRFRSFPNWYIVTKRITVGTWNTGLDSPRQ